MIKQVYLIADSKRQNIGFEVSAVGKASFDVDFSTLSKKSFDMEIEFDAPFVSFRNHDYRWVDLSKDRIAPLYTPKIIKNKVGQYIQPSIQSGIWEVSVNRPNVLLWRFNPPFSAPQTRYVGDSNEKQMLNGVPINVFAVPPSLLISASCIEFSRSQIPFSAIAVFTDHCDYDTPQTLKLQREFFRRHGIITTKGFFIHHYSKREDNASFAREPHEFEAWAADGHEMTCHSLSQSIKKNEEAFADFNNFRPPFHTPSWIDHGFQPYNLSMTGRNGHTEVNFVEKMANIGVTTLWNYIDSGTATLGVINQLNTDDFTLTQFSKGNRDVPLTRRLGMLIKNAVYHHDGRRDVIKAYSSAAQKFKRLVYQKKPNEFLPLVKGMGMLLKPFSQAVLPGFQKKIPYKLAKYAPIIFKAEIAGKPFFIFQTLEMVDFRKALHPANLEKLVSESGLFIAHTYFSVPMSYHEGRMFETPNQIDMDVAENFAVLGDKISKREIWNPTLDELVRFLADFDRAVLDLDHEGKIFVPERAGLSYRTVE